MKYIITGVGKGNYGGSNTQLTEANLFDIGGEKITNLTDLTIRNYSDLQGLPTIPTNNNQLTNGAGYITGLSWSNLTGKPSTFTPSAHSHDFSEIGNKPGSYPPSAHSHNWSEIGNKPASYTPSAHTHSEYDKYDFWRLQWGGPNGTGYNVGSGSILNVEGTGGTSVSFSGNTLLIDSAASANNYPTSLGFSTSTGIMTLGRSGLATLSQDLDGRYSLLGHTHDYDKYNYWRVITNGDYGTGYNLASGDVLNFEGTGGTTITRSGTTITINSTSGTGADGNNYLTGISGSGNGTVTFTRAGLTSLSWSSAHSHNWSEIGNKPSLFSGFYLELGDNLGSRAYITNGATSRFFGGTGISITRTGNDFTFNATGGGGTSDGNNYPTSLGFNTSTGILTLGRSGLATLSQDLDGRYSLSSHNHDALYDKYNYWSVGANASYSRVYTGDNVNFVGSGATSVSRSGNTITINSTSGGGTGADGNNYLTSANFDIGNGILTLGRSGLTGVTEDLDGRYAILSSTNTFTGAITAPDFVGSSDRSLKENIDKYSPKEINSKYKSFVFKSDETNQNRVGVIAQELELNHPEFVRTDENGLKAVSYQDLHSAEIAYLKNKVETQSKQIDELILMVKKLSK